jgi:hypothetical protein
VGQYDRAMKLLVESNPEAMARFIFHEWHKQQGAKGPEVPITAVTLLSEEFQSEELKGDGVWLVEGPEGPLYLVEIEYQSVLDPTMPLRSLEYLARAKKKHWKTCGELPVLGVVIYLFDEDSMAGCPLRWPGLNGTTALVFQYLTINMKELAREELLALREPALWPLALLTKGKVDRILIETMFAELLEQKLYNMLPIGHTIAAWFLRDDDLSWLHQEYQKMFEIFKDSPALQWMEDSVREEERKKAQLQLQEERKKARQQLRAEQKKAEQQLHAEQKKAEQQLRAEQKKAERRLQEKDKKALATFQQMVIGLVSQRFPTLLRLAKAQVHLLKQPERFQEVILRLSLARDIDEAQEILYSFNENETEEDTEEPL